MELLKLITMCSSEPVLNFATSLCYCLIPHIPGRVVREANGSIGNYRKIRYTSEAGLEAMERQCGMFMRSKQGAEQAHVNICYLQCTGQLCW